MPLPPELTVTIRRTNPKSKDTPAYLAVTGRANGAEVCSNAFELPSDLLIDMEPQWMLDKAVPRYPGEWVKRGPADAGRLADEEEKLAAYGQRLYGFLFGHSQDLEAFLRYNETYRRQARLTLAMHSNAAALWRLPWE